MTDQGGTRVYLLTLELLVSEQTTPADLVESLRRMLDEQELTVLSHSSLPLEMIDDTE